MKKTFIFGFICGVVILYSVVLFSRLYAMKNYIGIGRTVACDRGFKMVDIDFDSTSEWNILANRVSGFTCIGIGQNTLGE